MVLIVLDTNIFCRDYHLNGLAFKLFLDSYSRTGYKLCIPRVVLDETVNKYRCDLLEAYRKFQKAQNDLNRLLSKSAHLQPFSEELIETQVKSYRDFLQSTIEENGGLLLKYPKTSHEKIVQRVLDGKKPFKKDESGYRDFLIWESILSILRSTEEYVAFISANYKDFGEQNQLHEDLLADLHLLAIDPERINIYPSLEHINNELIIPKLQSLDELKDQLQKDLFPEFSLNSWVRKSFVEKLSREDWFITFLGFSEGDAKANFRRLVKIYDLKLDDLKLLQSKQILIFGTVTLRVILELEVDWEQYSSSHDMQYIFGTQGDEPFISAWKDIDLTTSILFSLILSIDDHHVISTEIDGFDTEYDGIGLSSIINPRPQKI